MSATLGHAVATCPDCGADVPMRLNVGPLGIREDGRLAADVRVRTDHHECTPGADGSEGAT